MTRDYRKFEPLLDVHPVTGGSFEVFFTDRTLETFGAGWFWWPRRRGFAPYGAAVGPFPTSYSAYRDAMKSPPERPAMRQDEAQKTMSCFHIASMAADRGSNNMCL
jgi:hypothetical protein